MRDILFREPDFVFSYRVGGILEVDGRILLQRPKGDDFAIIGGHVSAMETAAEALAREYREELHAEIEVGRLLAVGEIFFPWGNRRCHQVAFYYEVRLMDGCRLPEETFHGYDELDNERIDLDFIWLPREALRTTKVYPLELIPILLENREEVRHFVSRQTESAQ